MSALGTSLVLVVDDNAANRYAIARVLRQAGHRVLESATGTDALALVARERPDLVVLDVKLPDLSGYEVCRRIKADPLTAFALVLQVSATFVESRDAVRSLEGGADGYLTEPIEPPVLVATVRALLRARLAEEALRESEARHRLLFERNPLPSWVFDAETRQIVAVNEAAIQHYGYTREEFLAMGIAQLHPGGDADASEALAEGDAPGRLGVWRHARKDGTIIEAEVTVAPLAFVRRPARLVIATDVTERRRIEQGRAELLAREQHARSQAESANRAKDEFLATLSHELRTPLNAIYGWARVLVGPGADDEATRRRGLDAIERNSRLQARLIEDLLDVSRIITGKLTLERQPVDLVEVAQAAADTVRGAAAARQIELSVTSSQAAVLVEGDPGRLQQVVMNLLSNAIKFTGPGGRANVRVERDDQWARIVVSDTGKGIRKDFLPFIFDRFRQEDSSITRSYTGLGLGLAIVRHLVEAQGGHVQAASGGEGRGATFTITLPLVAAAIADVPATAAAAPPSRLDGVHVLVVDDDPDSLVLARVVLEAAGARVTTARSAEEAMAAVEQTRPHVLVSDVGMPDVDGIELLRQLRKRPGGDIPALALTAYAMDADAARMLAAGYRMHMPKPIDPGSLTAAVARLGGGR